jgi:dCMP deaminase
VNTSHDTAGPDWSRHQGRQSWDAYFLDLARATATRATCVRRKHGAVIVADRRIVATGYNGGPSGYGHCIDGACPRARSDTPMGQDYDNCIAIHAEANALLFSSPSERRNATLYCTGAPCFGCAKLIANSGIGEVVASGGRYDGWDDTRRFLLDSGVRVRLLDGLDDLPRLDLD